MVIVAVLVEVLLVIFVVLPALVSLTVPLMIEFLLPLVVVRRVLVGRTLVDRLMSLLEI